MFEWIIWHNFEIDVDTSFHIQLSYWCSYGSTQSQEASADGTNKIFMWGVGAYWSSGIIAYAT